MCDTQAINNLSVIGESVERAKAVPKRLRYRQHFYAFDLGQADETSLTAFGVDPGKPPIVYDFLVKNKTQLSEFSTWIVKDCKARNISPKDCIILLPFDGNQEMQGYHGEINRYKEMKKHMEPIGFRVELVTKVSAVRGVQLIRHVLETGMLGVEVNDRMREWIQVVASVDYKINKSTNKIEYVIDKRSGKFGDHPLDSLRYGCVYLFKELFKHEYWEDHTKRYSRLKAEAESVKDMFGEWEIKSKFYASKINEAPKEEELMRKFLDGGLI